MPRKVTQDPESGTAVPLAKGFEDLHPHNREAEESVLGAVMINPECFPRLAAILNHNDFYIVRNRWIWQAFSQLAKDGSPIDYLTTTSALEKIGRLKEAGGSAYLTALMNQTPTSLNAEAYAHLVREFAARRGILEGIRQTAALVADPRKNLDEILESLLETSKQATGSPQGRYSVRSVQYALEPRPDVKYLLQGLIYEKSISVIYGDGGTKKTWTADYLGVCISAGIPFGDLETQKTPVLFVDEENGESEMAVRTAFSVRGALADQNTQNVDFKYISLAEFRLDNSQDEAILTNEILAQKSGLVIFDALSDLMAGDENSKQDTQPVFNALRRIAEKTGAAILIIHHAKKDKAGYRGSSVIRDAPDILIRIDSDEDSCFVNFKTEKNRKGKTVKWSMFAKWTEDRFYLSHTEEAKKPKTLSKSCEYVIRFLTANHASELKAIMGSADTCSPAAAKLAVYQLVDLGMVYRTNPGESDRVPAIYDLKNSSYCKPENGTS